MQTWSRYPKFINIWFNLHPTFRVMAALTRSKFAILRAITQDIRQFISSIESEFFSLHLCLRNSIPDFSSFENKRNYDYIEFQSAPHKTILDKKFSSLFNSNLSAPPIAPLVQNSFVLPLTLNVTYFHLVFIFLVLLKILSLT